MNLRKLLETKPETLAEEQHDALKEHVIIVLDKVMTVIKSERYGDVGALTSSSPAGDGYGTDKSFIEFDWVQSNDGMDIVEVVEVLDSLKKVSTKEEMSTVMNKEDE